MKIQEAREQNLTTSEKRAVLGLPLDQSASPEANQTSDSIAERAMKRLKVFVTTREPEYQDTRYRLSTSNISKRMFPIARHALTNCHRGILSQLLMYIKQNFWSFKDSKSIVHDHGEDTTQEASPDKELSDNRTHVRQPQASAAPRTQ